MEISRVNTQKSGTRTERDMLGEVTLESDVLWGVHTHRALQNFPLSNRAVNRTLVHAFGAVKLACAKVNRKLGAWEGDDRKAEAIEQSCTELWEGLLDDHIVVDALQGGAGTSTNMNVNEVVANRACVLLGLRPGEYTRVSPHDDVNLHQSTNDTYPTALKVASITSILELESAVLTLQEAFQQKEKEFQHIVKIARTQLQDAVLITLGREMGAYAEAFNRDRWRIYKCVERLRVVNLGGGAVGTGLGSPRQFIFQVVDTLRELTGFGLARAENLIDATQNADVFVEVSGILKACACSLIKITNDLRLMSSGPNGGFGELRIPPRQSGSSIMPGKINPVIPEAVAQCAMRVIGNDVTISHAVSSGNLELSQFLPLVADSFLESIELLTQAVTVFRTRCVETLEADECRCGHALRGSTAVATALLAKMNYTEVEAVVSEAVRRNASVEQAALDGGHITPEEFEYLTSPEAVCRLGIPGSVRTMKNDAGRSTSNSDNEE